MSLSQVNMLKQQIRARGVLNEAVLDLLQATPRASFVPETHRHMAYADTAVPLPHGQQMLTPYLEALILDAAAISANDYVLEVGTGSGYLTVLMAQQAQRLLSIDVYPDFTHMGQSQLQQWSCTDATCLTGDASQRWDDEIPFDVVVLSGALPIVPPKYLDALAVGGRLLAFVGHTPTMQLVRIIRHTVDDWDRAVLLETEVLPLLQEPTRAFVL